MNDQDILNEITYRNHPLHEWEVGELEGQMNKFKGAIQNSPFKVVVGLCIYNEEQFIYDTLQDCRKIKDLDAIHILDGAWEGGGDSIASTDRTHADVVRWIGENNIPVTVERNKDRNIFRSEGEKRNYQLKRIQELYGDSYVLIHDGDETMRFNCGKDQIFLKETCSEMWPRPVIMKSYAYNGVNGAIGVRMIPTCKGIHYHTDKPMLVHNKSHDIICDYNFDRTAFVRKNATHDLDIMFFVNKWNIRNHDRAKEKDAYVEQVFSDGPVKDCTYV